MMRSYFLATMVVLALGLGVRASPALPGQAVAAAGAPTSSPTASASSAMPTTLGTRAGAVSLGEAAGQVRAALGRPDRDFLPGNQTGEWLYTARYVVRFTQAQAQPGVVWQVIAYSGATDEGFAVGNDKAAFKKIYGSLGIRSRARGWDGASGPIDELEVTQGNVVLGAEFAPGPGAMYISIRRIERASLTPAPTLRTMPPAAPADCGGASPPSLSPAPILRTNSGPVETRVARDDSWTRPALVPSQFLFWSSPANQAYQDIICHSVYAYGYGNSEGSKMLLAFDPLPKAGPPITTATLTSLDHATPGLGLQLWLMDVHFLGMSADSQGSVTVQLERRPGFEWVVFDLETVAVSPHSAGALNFRFVDMTGREMLPPLTRGVRASWEYGRTPAP